MDREKALNLLLKYNKEFFHIKHALTVEGTMRYIAREFGEDEEFWGIVGLLHDVDYGSFPTLHCVKAVALLSEIDAPKEMVHAICSHGYGLTETTCKPEKKMEKVLFCIDELTGLIGASALMRPSKSVMDMEVTSIKKKFKDKHFAAGCNREVISNGAKMLNMELAQVFEITLNAMKSCENEINDYLKIVIS